MKPSASAWSSRNTSTDSTATGTPARSAASRSSSSPSSWDGHSRLNRYAHAQADGLGHAGYRTAVPLSAAQAIGVFDSGVGGLTVLDECLAALPAEDFVYFGDTAFFPYGRRAPTSCAGGRWRSCAGSTARPSSSSWWPATPRPPPCSPGSSSAATRPVVGVMGPEAHAAVQATRNRRIGLLATEATVRSGSYERMVQANDAGVQVTSVACPRLAPAIQSGDPFDQAIVDMVREYAAPLVAARVDTVILGCTHYPMVERLIRRSLPGVTLIKSGEEIAREVRETLARKGLARPPGSEGGYRFACSGDAGAFRELGSRFLQMPLGPVASVDPEAVPTADAVHARCRSSAASSP